MKTKEIEKNRNEQDDVERMFCAYCRRTLVNARTDFYRKKARSTRRELLFADMHEAELQSLIVSEDVLKIETPFEVLGHTIDVADEDIAEALLRLDEDDRTIILLRYFAGWPDGLIAQAISRPRSTVQFRRSRALMRLRSFFEERGICP